MWLKACPRCHGDLMVERLPGELEITCLQCGYNPPPAVAAQFLSLVWPDQRPATSVGPTRETAERVA